MSEVKALTELTWDGIRALEMTQWLWLSMAEGGLQRGDQLPAEEPTQLSHIWAWSDTALLRIRADDALPGRYVGAMVARPAENDLAEVQLWATDSGKISAEAGRSFRAGGPEPRLWEYRVWVGETERMPLTFYCGEPGKAETGATPGR